jgi:hypothetical protein
MSAFPIMAPQLVPTWHSVLKWIEDKPTLWVQLPLLTVVVRA